jgi:hypothetical protein
MSLQVRTLFIEAIYSSSSKSLLNKLGDVLPANIRYNILLQCSHRDPICAAEKETTGKKL